MQAEKMGIDKGQCSVYVYGLCDVFYDSYYLQGLHDFFTSYHFNIDKFPKIRQGVFAVIIEHDGRSIKIIIDSADTSEYYSDELAWCDIYGKINVNNKNIPRQFQHKIFPIGPSFGIKIWNIGEMFYHLTRNYIICRRVISNKREFIANYWRQYNRKPIKSYTPQTSKERYVFFTGAIWKREETTNEARAAFIEACRANPDITFEGGFAPRRDNNNLHYNHLLADSRYKFSEYLTKLRESAIAFNTPAVLSCHGWKLGEFLALGKAMITTPHLNELPSPLQEQVHVVYAKNLSAIAEKIDLLIKDHSLRLELEKNARAYFDNFLAPAKVIERLFLHAHWK